MADEFEHYLASALAPPERLPDRRFVSRVQAGIALEERLAVQRRSVIGTLIKQLAALFSVAAAVWLIGHAPPVASLFADAPALMLVILLTSFICVVGLIAVRPGTELDTSSLL